jgi:hypothetical protein
MKKTFSGLAQILRIGDLRIEVIKGKIGNRNSGRYPNEKTLFKIA